MTWRAGLGPALVFLVWEIAGHGLADLFVLSPPSAVLLYLWDNFGLMSRALGETLRNASIGFLIGNVVAVLLAACAITWPRSDALLRGLALLVFCLPLVATGPILRVFFGPGPWPQITLAALAVYYTTLIPLLVGLRAVPSGWIDLVRSYGRGRFTDLVHVRSRASVPYLVAGLQIAAPAAFLGAMVGEFTGAERGMGVLTIRAMRDMNIEATWALATVATTVSVIWFVAIGKLASRYLSSEPPTILAPIAGTNAKSLQGKALDLLMITVAGLALWAGLIWALDLNSFFAKGPEDVFRALSTASDAASNRATLLSGLGETAIYLLPGYFAGLLAGAGLAIVLVLWPTAASTAMPVAIALRSVPIITTAPLVVLLLGRGGTGTITLVAIMAFFPSFVACLSGLRQVPGQILDVLDSYAAGPLTKLVRVRIPSMLPAFFGAARINVPASILAITVVEWLATGQGIGQVMALSASLSDYDLLWSSVALVAILSVIGYALVGQAERAVLSRYAPEQLA